jgi:transcriptional regulator with XRE-family HTH domain
MWRAYKLSRPSWQKIREFSAGCPSFGKKLRERREEKRMTIRAAAELANIAASDWMYLEQGRKWPWKEIMPFLAEFFDMPPKLFEQDVKRIGHELIEFKKKHKEVVEWLERETKADEAHRTLIIR